MPWHRVTTDDLVTFIDAGLALPTGTSPDSQDHNCYTGSVVRDDAGVHHPFYTAQNPIDPDGRRPLPRAALLVGGAVLPILQSVYLALRVGTASPICSSSAFDNYAHMVAVTRPSPRPFVNRSSMSRSA